MTLIFTQLTIGDDMLEDSSHTYVHNENIYDIVCLKNYDKINGGYISR